MTLTGAIIILAVGLLLVFLTVGVSHIIGIVIAAVAAAVLIMLATGTRRP